MTVLDFPFAVGVHDRGIRDDLDVVRVFADEVGKHGADEGLHSAADKNALGWSRWVRCDGLGWKYLETMITGMSWLLQY